MVIVSGGVLLLQGEQCISEMIFFLFLVERYFGGCLKCLAERKELEGCVTQFVSDSLKFCMQRRKQVKNRWCINKYSAEERL